MQKISPHLQPKRHGREAVLGMKERKKREREGEREKKKKRENKDKNTAQTWVENLNNTRIGAPAHPLTHTHSLHRLLTPS